MKDLDPTQRAFAEMALRWLGNRSQSFLAILLGTAGTGKTTTLKALLAELRRRGIGKVLVGAFTGVAASNLGLGARTLHDIFQLAKVNESSGSLTPPQGEDLKEFKEAMEGLEMLVVDEFSMVSRLVLQQMHERLREWRLAEGQIELASQPFGGIAVILAGDMGQLPPIAVSPSFSLLNTSNVHDAREQKLLNHGKRLLQKFTTVVRLRRIHRQPGVSPYKESLIRLRDAAMTKEDHELWRQHNLNDLDACTLTPEEKQAFEEDAVHLFAENAVAGERNGFKVGRQAVTVSGTVLRVASRDSTEAASRATYDMYGQVRRVVHLARGAPVMLISNLRTSLGLVNGAVGKLVAVELREGSEADDGGLRDAVSADKVRYAVVEFPQYNGPAIWPDHPKWVPVEPLPTRHKKKKQWERFQLPLALAWGMTIHKSQGLTFTWCYGAVRLFRGQGSLAGWVVAF